MSKRRMRRRNKKSHHKRRRNGSLRTLPRTNSSRRRRRNEGAKPKKKKAASKKKAAAPKAPRIRRSITEREAALEAKLAKLRSQSQAKVAKEQEKAAKAQARAAKAEAAKAAKAAKAAARTGPSRGYASRMRKVISAVRRQPELISTLDPTMARYVSAKIAQMPARKPRKKKQRTQNWHKAHNLSKRGTKGEKAIVRAWRSAKRAQALAVAPKERRLLQAMGLAGVPNPGMMGSLKDIGTLLPQIGGTVAGLLAGAVVGQIVADKALSAEAKDKWYGKAAPSVVSLLLGVGGYLTLRKTKMAKAAPFVLAGGVAAAVVHAIARITVKGKDAAGAEVSMTLGKRLGLPIGEYSSMAGYGEYSSMAGFGEYSSMAGGTAYSGERGIFSGLDDTDPVLHGTDDEDEVDMVETASDEGVNADEGSLNGSIFD